MVFERVFVVLIFTATLATGCATERDAPFHIYQSPLLAAQSENPRVADRSFDPAAPGDYPEAEPERVVAQNDGESVWEEGGAKPSAEESKSEKKQDRKRRKKGLFSLSSNRVGGKGTSGSSSAEAGDFAPAKAAAYVHKTLEVNGIALPGESRTSIPKIWSACKSQKKTHQGDPLPGDAVFFHNAFDANSDGRNNDWYTHVGIVESVGTDGTATVLSWQGGQVTRLKVNPKKPDSAEVDGKVVNSRLRKPSADDAPYTQYYAGQLFAGWCTFLDGKKDVVVMEQWSP